VLEPSPITLPLTLAGAEVAAGLAAVVGEVVVVVWVPPQAVVKAAIATADVVRINLRVVCILKLICILKLLNSSTSIH
jgi:hypothetical protein